MKSKAVLFTGPNQVEIGEVDIPKLESQDVLVEASYSCISPGTDLRVLAGKQQGIGDWPIIPGYSMVGQVIEKGSQVKTLEAGDWVFCTGTQKSPFNRAWGGHLSHAVTHEAALFVLPEKIDPIQAGLCKLAAIAYHGMTRTQPRDGEEVALIGLGPIGLLAGIFHRLSGSRVVATDLSKERRDLAETFGLETCAGEGTLSELFAQKLPEGADIIVDSTGIPAVLNQSLSLARELPWTDHWAFGSRLLIQGSYPGKFELDYPEAFMKEIRLLLTRDHQSIDLESVIELMAEEKIDIRRIISEIRPYHQAASAFADLQASKSGLMTIALQWSSD